MTTRSLFRTKGAQREFLVLWEGWPIEDASWVNQKDVTPYLLKYELYHIVYMLNMIILLSGHLMPLSHLPVWYKTVSVEWCPMSSYPSPQEPAVKDLYLYNSEVMSSNCCLDTKEFLQWTPKKDINIFIQKTSIRYILLRVGTQLMTTLETAVAFISQWKWNGLQ